MLPIPGNALPKVLGIDLLKPAPILEAAYNDGQGITAAFNLNLLVGINRELEGDFDLEAFRHLAFWNPERSRIEMHLRSLKAKKVRVAGREFEFLRDETIRTENSYKHDEVSLARPPRDSGGAHPDLDGPGRALPGGASRDDGCGGPGTRCRLRRLTAVTSGSATEWRTR